MFSCNANSQGMKELQNLKCLKDMPNTYEEIQNKDTIYILYHKSDIKGYEQNNINYKNPEIDSYYFYNYIHFPMYLYDYDKFKMINIQKPQASFVKIKIICKKIKQTIDVCFLKKFGYEFYVDFYKTKRTTFIIDLDKKIKNRYKVIQVNNPTYIID